MPRLIVAVAVFAAYIASCVANAAAGERLVLANTEARTLVFVKANEEALRKLVPAGWLIDPEVGPLAGANMFFALIEGIAAESPDGKPVLHQGKTVAMVLSVKHEKTGTEAAMVVGGFVTDPQASPGAYDVYVPAKIAMTRTSRAEDSGATVVEESWEVTTPAGDTLRFNAAYARGIGARVNFETRVYAAVKPDFYRIYRADQVTEIVHSAVDQTKRARTVALSGAGPLLGKLLDGKDQIVGVMAIPAYRRQVFLPE